MLAGDIPFETDEQILAGELAWYEPALCISPGARQLVAGCLDRDPDTRLSIDQILSHPWLQSSSLPSSSSSYPHTLAFIKSNKDLQNSS